MIERITLFLALLIILPDLYIDSRYIRRSDNWKWWKSLLWFAPGLFMLAYTARLDLFRNFVPDDMGKITIYMLLLALLVFTKAAFSLFSLIGLAFCELRICRRNWGNVLGIIAAGIVSFIAVYGFNTGFSQLNIVHQDIYINDLPPSFEGYTIAHISDFHLGTFHGRRKKLVTRDIDSINSQHADMICFTGDLQNIQPSDIYPFMHQLKQLRAKDGIYSVLGNHDYSMYIDGEDALKRKNEKKTIHTQELLGWELLNNAHRVIRKNGDSIIVAGMENSGHAPFPHRGNINAALHGTEQSDFVVMLQHDPVAWREIILPHSNAQLTLSGHTHAGQMKLFGYRFSRLRYQEDYGLYKHDGRFLYVTSGLGGVIPFRFNAPAEVAVIKLHRKK